MKAYLEHLVSTAPTPWLARHWVREYLQVRLLYHLQRQGAMTLIAFQGGTALRFLFQLQRFSEDLDFSLEAKQELPLQHWLTILQRHLQDEGYTVSLHRIRADRIVASAFIRFPGLLYQLGLSPHRDEQLSVKIEIDTRPPQGARTRTTLVRKYNTLLHLYHHDAASLLSGKIHALLQRPYLKGRDVYDLLWMLSDPQWPEPNLTLLTQALIQSRHPHPKHTALHWREAVWQRLAQASWEEVRRDIAPFLEDPDQLALLTPATLRALLRI